MAPHRDKLEEDMDVPLEMCASLKGPTHEKLKSGQIYFRASFRIFSKIIKKLYFKLLQIVSFNTMMLIGMKSSDN